MRELILPGVVVLGGLVCVSMLSSVPENKEQKPQKDLQQVVDELYFQNCMLSYQVKGSSEPQSFSICMNERNNEEAINNIRRIECELK